MSRILAYTSPSAGQLFPVVPILAELRRRGHEVVARTGRAQVPVLGSEGIAADAIDPAIEAVPIDDWRARTPPGAIARAQRRFGQRAPHEARDLERAIAAERPDALLVDVLASGALIAADAWGGPWAATCPFPPPDFSPAVPPPGPGLAPARGPAGRLRDRLLRRPFAAAFDRVALPALRPLWEDRGSAPLRHAPELYTLPPLLLCLTAEPFEYPRPARPANALLVGPCPWEPAAALPGALEDVRAPLVLVTTSTELQRDERLVRTALRALADEPCHVLATMPTGVPPDLDPPANATVVEFAPHRPVLERAACAVTHGGMGATQKALALGVPVCAVPFGRDQFEVARRVVVAGAGSSLPEALLTPRLLRRRVRAAARRRAGAEHLANAFAGAGGASAAADACERLVAGWSPEAPQPTTTRPRSTVQLGKPASRPARPPPR